MPPPSFTTIPAQQFSDLVKDSRLETEALDTCTQHVFYETGRTAHERHVRRTEQWVRQRFLGQGAYGIVHLEKRKAGLGEKERLRAVKEIKKYVGSAEELDYARELEAIAKFSNYKYAHCFVTSHGWFETNESVFIAMEYLAHGDLQQHLTRPLSEIEARQITSQVLEGLQYMHENGFVHRDLKPSNIMVVNKGPDWFVKIADFGISKRRQQDVTTLHTLQRGTLGFAAPEVFGFAFRKRYTFSVDMWSLGAVTYRMLTQSTPFPTIADLSAYVFKQKGFPTALFEAHQVSKTAQNLIFALMVPDPQDRLTAITAGEHEWLSGTPSTFIGQQPASECAPWSTKTVHTICIADNKDRSSLPPPTVVHTDEVVFTAASNAWSTDNITVSLANTPLRATAGTPDYQSPIGSENPEDETMQEPKLSVDSVVLLKEVCPATPSPVDPSIEEPRSSEEAGYAHTSGTSVLPKTILSETPAFTTQVSAVATAQDQSSYRMQLHNAAELNEITHTVGEYAEDKEQLENKYAIRDDEKEDYDDAESTIDDADSIKEETQILEFWCHWCSELTKGSRSGPTEQLACQHVVCHACLLEAFALSLISPVYMAPRCCGEVIPLWYFRRIFVRPEVSEAWGFMYEFTEKMRAGPWLCRNGHVGKPEVSINRLPMWKRRVACERCKTQKLNGKLKSVSFCLFCKGDGKECKGYCVGRCDDAIDSFVQKMQFVDDIERNMAAHACDVKNAIKEGKYQGWQPWEEVQNDFVLRCAPMPPPDELHQPTSLRPQPHDTVEGDLTSRHQGLQGRPETSLRKAKLDVPRIPPPSPPSPRTHEENGEHGRLEARLESLAHYLPVLETQPHKAKIKEPRIRTPPPSLPSASTHQPADYDSGPSTPESTTPIIICFTCGLWPDECPCDEATPLSNTALPSRRSEPAAEQVKYGRLCHSRKGSVPDNFAAFDGYVPPHAEVQGMNMEDVDAWRFGVHPDPPSTPTRVHTRNGFRQAPPSFSRSTPASGPARELLYEGMSAQNQRAPLFAPEGPPEAFFPKVKYVPEYDAHDTRYARPEPRRYKY